MMNQEDRMKWEEFNAAWWRPKKIQSEIAKGQRVDFIHYPYDLDKVLLADGFEDAFIGIVESFGTLKACYDLVQCLDILMVRDNMTYDEAVEYMDFNVLQGYPLVSQENKPAFIHMIDKRSYDGVK